MNELVDGVCATRKKMVMIQTICIWICYACCAMSGLVPQMTLSLITIFCVVINALEHDKKEQQ